MNQVAIWTDSMGTFQARCLDCAWKGPWRRKEETAVADARPHGEEHYDSANEDRKYVDGCATCETIRVQHRGFGPRHDAMRSCQSGKRSHCTCDTCF